MNIPNFLTLLRFLLIPLFFYTYYVVKNDALAFSVFIFAGITDILDGYIARKYDKVTQLGKLMDPLADKAIQLSVLFALTDSKRIPWFIILIVLFKEMFLIIGSGLLYKRRVIIQSKWYGKLTTVLFYLAILTIIFINVDIGIYFLIATVSTALYAAFRYAKYYLVVSQKG